MPTEEVKKEPKGIYLCNGPRYVVLDEKKVRVLNVLEDAKKLFVEWGIKPVGSDGSKVSIKALILEVFKHCDHRAKWKAVFGPKGMRFLKELRQSEPSQHDEIASRMEAMMTRSRMGCSDYADLTSLLMKVPKDGEEHLVPCPCGKMKTAFTRLPD